MCSPFFYSREHIDDAVLAERRRIAELLSEEGFCAMALIKGSALCSDEDSDCCLRCWEKVLTPTEGANDAGSV